MKVKKCPVCKSKNITLTWRLNLENTIARNVIILGISLRGRNKSKTKNKEGNPLMFIVGVLLYSFLLFSF